MHFLKKIEFNKFIILSFLVCLVIFYIIRLNQLFDYSVNHATSWWLFNYEYGLARRGLIGQILFYFSSFFNFNILDLLEITQSILFSVFIFLIGNYIFKKKITNYFLLYFFSPSLFLIYVYDIFYIARQEIFIFIYFFIYISKIRESSNNKYSFLFDTFIFSLLTLIHESMIFYFSYFFVADLIFCKNKKIPKIIFNFIIHFIVCALIAYMLVNTNNSDFLNLICNDIIQLGGHQKTCDDLIVSSLNLSISEIIKVNINWIVTHNYLFNYLLLILLSCIPFLFIKNFLHIENKNIKKIFILILTNTIFSLPLFYLAYDWGRWIHMHFILIFIILINFLPDKNSIFEQQKNPRSDLILIIFIMIYAMSWSIPVCCEDQFTFGIFEKINNYLKLS